jgi:outer membrane protein assembly factor BamA
MKFPSLFACVIFLAAVPSFSDPVVSSITITDNRVLESIVRRKLAFRVGDTINDDKVTRTRKNLYAMGLFKALDIQQQSDGSEGVAVTVKARDGWFVLPWVMAGSRGGEGYTGVMLMEQNYFRRAENLMYFGMFQNSMQLNTFALMLPDLSLSAAFNRSGYSEYRYGNGSYNSTVLVGSGLDKLLDLGPISDSYNPESESTRLSATVPLDNKIRVSAGVNLSKAEYSPISGTVPDDAGSYNAVQAGFSYGRTDGGSGPSGSFGRIFGMGMADLQENFRPLPCMISEWGIQAIVEPAFKALGSEHDYLKTTLSASRETNFCNYSRLLLAARIGVGSTLPFSQLFASGRRDGMMGVYAREFRGDKVIVVQADYRYSFVRNHTGTLNADFFTEASALTDHLNNNYGKQGVGCNLSWQFWRFPLPIGFGYTYCVDDNNWQATFAVGGMF